jgi:hypothetical protein
MTEAEINQKVLELAEQIRHHRQLEVHEYARNLAVGMSNVNYNAKPLKIWITNRENQGSTQKLYDFTGNPLTLEGQNDTVMNDGMVVYKNTMVGECIIRNLTGKHKIAVPAGIMDLEINNFSTYTPHKHEAEAIDLKFNLNLPKPITYNSLKELLNLIKDKEAKIEKLEAALEQVKTDAEKEHQANQIIERIEKLKQEKQQALNKARNFIRVAASLRYQPILDPWQEEVKRALIYDGTLAIDGGPGTGKTTSLIQRIKFLIDPVVIAEYLTDLTKDKKDKLLNNDQSWIFFSPNELLKLYLKNNMVEEGLKASDERVLIWSDHKEFLVRQYKLVNTETDNPFLFLRQDVETNLLSVEGKKLHAILSAFEQYYAATLNRNLQQLLEINCDGFFWKERGKSIQAYIKRQDNDYSIDGLIKLYFNIEENYANEVKGIAREFGDLLEKVVSELLVDIEKDILINLDLEDLMEHWMKDAKSENIEDDEDGEDDDNDDVINEDEELQTEQNLQLYLFQKLRSLIRKVALQPFDRKVRLSKKDQTLRRLIEKYISQIPSDQFKRIGELAFFIKYFEKSARGVSSNIFSPVALLYKLFRKQALSSKQDGWNLILLERIVKEIAPKNKRLHPDEQALMLYFINKLIKKSFKMSKLKTQKLNHPFVRAYQFYSKPVIAIDEATDFHLIDLIAIHSLSDYEIFSVTYCGDLMQRLTENGLRTWDDLKNFIPKFEKKNLAVSYRQSPTLLKLAEKIYEKATNKQAEYISHLDYSEDEPKPLLFNSFDEKEKRNWIAERIIEIHRAYGDELKPSIAIFLASEDQIDDFARALGEIDRLANVGLRVKACSKGQVLGDENMIRVFSLEYIKGLEFQAVFFHNIHEALHSSNQQMMLKNIYVGLSRAAFYLGVTANEKVKELDYLENIFDAKTDWN